jgi:hypothetical protein
MQAEQTKPKTKRAYEKPKLRMIELATGEVLATGCKTALGSLTGYEDGFGCGFSPCVQPNDYGS